MFVECLQGSLLAYKKLISYENRTLLCSLYLCSCGVKLQHLILLMPFLSLLLLSLPLLTVLLPHSSFHDSFTRSILIISSWVPILLLCLLFFFFHLLFSFLPSINFLAALFVNFHSQTHSFLSSAHPFLSLLPSLLLTVSK